MLRTIPGLAAMLVLGCAQTCPPCERPARAEACPPTVGAESFAAIARPRPPAPTRRHFSFTTAKRRLRTVYADHRIEVYCGCRYNDDDEIVGRCPYRRREGATGSGVRGERMEWEHVVPAARFGQHRQCWYACGSSEGRDCCGASLATTGDEQFRWMEGDMHNLMPSNGQLNADRRDRAYGEIPGEDHVYGTCDFEIDRSSLDGVTEPPDNIRGDVARVWLYMADEYEGGLTLTMEERTMFERWSDLDEVDDWERQRDTRIAAAQGNHNPYVAAPE